MAQLVRELLDGDEPDSEGLAQEVALTAARLDVSEEIVRLESHLRAAGELIEAVRRAHAREVVLLPNDADLRVTAAAAAEARSGATLLVKGSRFMQMERVAEALARDGGRDAV